MNFVTNHAADAGLIVRPIDQQSRAIPLYHRCTTCHCCRINRSTYWPAVQQATTVPWMTPSGGKQKGTKLFPTRHIIHNHRYLATDAVGFTSQQIYMYALMVSLWEVPIQWTLGVYLTMLKFWLFCVNDNSEQVKYIQLLFTTHTVTIIQMMCCAISNSYVSLISKNNNYLWIEIGK